MSIPISAGMSTVAMPWQTDEYGQKYYITKDGKRHYKSESSGYIGYSSNSGLNAEVNGIGLSQSGFTFKPTSTKITQNRGYSRNVAATAKDISQGGMTKQEVQEFNMKHPNETAWRNE